MIRFKKLYEDYKLVDIVIFFYIVIWTMYKSLFRIIIPFNILRYAVFALRLMLGFSALLLIINRGFLRKKEILLFLAFFVFFLLSYYYSKSFDIFDCLFVVIFFSRYLEYDKTIKNYFYSLLISSSIIVVFYFLGGFPEYDVYRNDGRLRFNPGFLHPNDFSRTMMILFFLYILNKKDNIKLYDLVIGIVISFFVYTFPNSRNVTYCMILFLILLGMFKVFSKIDPGIFKKKIIKNICIVGVIVLVFFSWLFVFDMSKDEYLQKIDKNFFSRYKCARIGIEQYGIKLFGDDIPFTSEFSQRFFDVNNAYYVLDSVYLYLPIARGVIPSFFVLYYFIKAIKESFEKENMILLFICMVFAIYSFVEPGILYFISSFIFVLPEIYKKNSNISKGE